MLVFLLLQAKALIVYFQLLFIQVNILLFQLCLLPPQLYALSVLGNGKLVQHHRALSNPFLTGNNCCGCCLHLLQLL